ncbi:MAG: helicase [Akkermansiaceae bacterium]|nr:helicase [Akkermansiaceae bacterium]
MATLLNASSLTRSAVTPGERRFGQRLQSHLEDDYLCWFDVPVGSRRRYPDFVILHPQRGLLILEVKDWKIHEIRRIDKSSTEVFFGGVPRSFANPLEQARQCTMELINQLNTDAQLCHSDGPYQGRLSFPYGWGVVLTAITRKQLDEALPTEAQELVLPGRLVICKDEMVESVSAGDFQERLWGMFLYRFRQPLSLPQIERIRWHLFPEVRIAAPQPDLFGEEAPLPELMKVLDLQQEQLARSLGSGHRVIHGVAGSGKTLILGYRCIQLADSLSKPVLVLCFNVSLAARLLRFVEERGLAGKVCVHHFHEWCGQQLRTYHAGLPPGDAAIWERQVEGVIQAVDAGRIPRAQYGAVMIDEGHDFEPEWLKLVVQMVDPASDSFLLLYDDAQSIYRKSRGLGFSLSSVGVKAAGRTTVLRLNYRNSREILKFAYDFAKGSLGPKGADDDHIPLIEPESAGLSGPAPRFRKHRDFQEELAYAVRCIRRWLEGGTAPQEIALIYFNNELGRQISACLRREGLDHLWMENKARKKEFDPAKPRLTVLSAQSSKGLEFQAVVILGVGFLPCAEAEISQQTRLLYVGMTRAKRQLAITGCGENAFVQRLEALAG